MRAMRGNYDGLFTFMLLLSASNLFGIVAAIESGVTELNPATGGIYHPLVPKEDDSKVEAILCPKNQYMVDSKCQACPRGSYVANGKCLQCGEHQMTELVNSTECLCQRGYYEKIVSDSNGEKQRNCTRCPKNSTTPGPGHFSIDSCTGYSNGTMKGACMPGFEVDPHSYVCVPCKIGSFSIDGKKCHETEETQTTMKIGSSAPVCIKGYYSTPNYYSTSQVNCLKCPMGYTTSGVGAVGEKECFMKEFVAWTIFGSCAGTVVVVTTLIAIFYN
ncbi:MAG: calcium ion binding [Marteilia pararefringens]